MQEPVEDCLTKVRSSPVMKLVVPNTRDSFEVMQESQTLEFLSVVIG